MCIRDSTCTDGHRYPLLAESRTGYQNLCRLITRMKMRAKKGEGAAAPEEFAEFSQGLVFLASRPDPRLLDLFGACLLYTSLTEELAQVLETWGIYTFEQLAQLPETGLAERFGSTGVYLQRLARNAIHRPLKIFQPETTYEAVSYTHLDP